MGTAEADVGGLTEAAGRVRLDPVRAVGKLIFWLTMLVVVLLASSALGLENVREMFGRMLGFIPTLISGTVIIILGMIIGEFVRAVIVASAGRVEGVVTVAFSPSRLLASSPSYLTTNLAICWRPSATRRIT